MNDTIRQSIVTLAEKSPYVDYKDLHIALGTQTDRDLESLLIEAIYEGIIDGKLDPSKRLLEIMDWKASIPSAQRCTCISQVLSDWIQHCEVLIGDLNKAATISSEHAKQVKEEEETHEKEIEEQRETLQTSGKSFGAEAESSSCRKRVHTKARFRRE